MTWAEELVGEAYGFCEKANERISAQPDPIMAKTRKGLCSREGRGVSVPLPSAGAQEKLLMGRALSQLDLSFYGYFC